MLDLQEHLEELFGYTSFLESPEFNEAYIRVRNKKLEYMLQWARVNKRNPIRLKSKREAQKRYEASRPESIHEYSKRKWQKTKNSPHKLQERREYQRLWAKKKRGNEKHLTSGG